TAPDDPAADPVAPPAPEPEPEGPAEPCPRCQTPRLDDAQFCEGCGFDYVDPNAEPTMPIDDERPTWHAVIETDRDQYDRSSPDDIVFPAGLDERVIALDQDCIRIGRRS